MTFELTERHFIYAYLLGLSLVFVTTLLISTRHGLALRIMEAYACVNVNTIFCIPLVSYYLGDARSALLVNILQPLLLLPIILLSLSIIEHKTRIRDYFFNFFSLPLILSIILGFIMVKFNMKLPGIVINGLDYVGKLTYFLAPICFGANIFAFKQQELMQWSKFKHILTFRLLFFPWVSTLIAYFLFDLDRYWLLSIWIITASPMGLFIPLIAEKFALEPDDMRVALTLSSVASLIMISFVLLIIDVFKI